MDVIKRETTLVGVVTLIVGLGLGLGIGVWGIKTSQGSSLRTTSDKKTSETSAKIEPNDSSEDSTVWRDDWDPFRQMQEMQEEIDRTIRRATSPSCWRA